MFLRNLAAASASVAMWGPLLSSDVVVPATACGNSLPKKHDGGTMLRFKRGPQQPVRNYYIYTPLGYDRTKKSKVVLSFHGWGGKATYYSEWKKFQEHAERYNYAIVAIDGLGGTKSDEYRSWSFPGSSDGLGLDGTTVTTCDTSIEKPDYCYASQCECANRCGWTHCADDDLQMIADFLARSDGLRGSLCFDPAATFALGDSNGGMFAWSLAQDSRTAPLLAGIAPVIAAPHCDHDRPQAKGTQVPVLSQTGKWDETVSPSELPWPGNPGDKCVTNRDGDMYRYLASHWITTTWAQGVEGCAVDRLTFPTKKYKFKGLSKESTLKCRTWCKGWKAHSVDCAFDGGHDSPEFTMQAALIFFDRHLPKKKRFDCRKIKKKQHCKKTSCAWKKKKCVSGS